MVQRIGFCLSFAAMLVASPAWSDRPSLTTFGTPGLIEMPTAEVLGDGELAFTASSFGPNQRYSATFQILPRLHGTFRYSIIEGFNRGGTQDRFDRSFDLHYQLVEETDRRPGVGVGLRDFLGTGIYSGEYVVATKRFGPKLTVTGGLGWGRFAGRGSFSNPLGIFADYFKNRPPRGGTLGGTVRSANWFRGPASFFGGVKLQLTDRTAFLAEFSPDLYPEENQRIGFQPSSGFNFGIDHSFENGLNIKAYTVGGSNFGLQFSYTLNPAKRLVPGGYESAPQPLVPRSSLANARLDGRGLGTVLKTRFENEGVRLQSVQTSGDTVTVKVQNLDWDAEGQAVGRVNRILANSMPPHVETFVVVFQDSGVPITSVTTNRTDFEELQFDYDGAWRTLARAQIADYSDQSRDGELADAYPSFDWRLRPYTAQSFFDPDAPIRVEIGPELSFALRPSPGLTFGGILRYPVAGNIDTATRRSNSVIQRVRSDAVLYSIQSDLEINVLTAEYMWRPGKDLFGRVTAGYLENMYGGISTELLWYPEGSRLALGAELNYVKQRDFDMLFGFQNYSVFTGHASLYYALPNDYRMQIDVGRYLAGDWGFTFGLDREFNNGFKVGGFFTLTDVPFDQFGEGSFDKGVRFEIPISWLTGRPTRRVISETIRPVLRDGGARLNVSNRLFGVVKDYRGNNISDTWGRYYR